MTGFLSSYDEEKCLMHPWQNGLQTSRAKHVPEEKCSSDAYKNREKR